MENEDGKVLLVRTRARSDTWELPGGQVEEGEALDAAVQREFLEETGASIRPIGVTGMYYNQSNTVLSIIFRAEYLGGEIVPQPEEIIEAQFVALNEANMDEYITRPNMKSRTLDVMRGASYVPYETWVANPTRRLIYRLDPLGGSADTGIR